MLLKKVNIEEKLGRLKTNNLSTDLLLNEVHDILDQNLEVQKIIKRFEKNQPALQNNFIFDLLETNKIYHITQIKSICIAYRLRFLDSKYFKGEIPPEAICKIKNLEKKHEILINGFKIIAPSKLFKLKDKDDPILFAPIGNDYFYLIHSWGNDLHSLRKLLMWPFKNIVNLAILVLAISVLVTLLIPEGLFSKSNSNMQFGLLLFFMFKSIAAIVIFYGFALGKNFNTAVWNSKYFNA